MRVGLPSRAVVGAHADHLYRKSQMPAGGLAQPVSQAEAAQTSRGSAHSSLGVINWCGHNKDSSTAIAEGLMQSPAQSADGKTAIRRRPGAASGSLVRSQRDRIDVATAQGLCDVNIDLYSCCLIVVWSGDCPWRP
jgi:chloramphenicol 3-O-phosphotransferase